VFAASWQWSGVTQRLDRDGAFAPSRPWADSDFEEPLLLWRDGACLRALSNVCTHRGAVLVDEPGCARTIGCRYHGRRFNADGSVAAAPGFERVEGFPTAEDALARASLGWLGPLSFVAIEPALSFEEWTSEARAWTGHLPWDQLVFDPEGSKDYVVHAHWALYCENYLEGLHVPFVHRALARRIGVDDYRVLPLEHGALQIAYPRSPSDPSLSAAACDVERRPVAAYYVFLFPNTMINVYPWGVSLNVVDPLAPEQTRVRFRSWVWNPALRSVGAGAALDEVELEDEAVVRSVHRGVQARLYPGGRYAPAHEEGLRRFHALLARAIGGR
jgi:choline monooxygenase